MIIKYTQPSPIGENICVSFSASGHSDEVTTLSLSLLTDRTLMLRAHKGVAEVAITSKCKGVLAKYNVTRKEYRCVCWAYCPWRPLTDIEEEYFAEYSRKIVRKRIIRHTVMGIIYSFILIFGLTGIDYSKYS